MYKIDELREKYIMDIIVTVLIVIVSVPLWLNIDLSEAYAEAQVYDNFDYINYEVTNSESYSLAAMSDEEASSINTSDILIYNSSNTNDDYTLYLILEDKINFDNLKISINNQIYYLNDFKYDIKNGYRYYIIASDSIVATSSNYSVSMWNDSKANNEEGYITPEFAVNI